MAIIKNTYQPIGDIIILEILPKEAQSGKYGDLFLPDKPRLNTELLKCKIISLGEKIKDEVKVGDTVLIDKWSCFANPTYRVGDLVATRLKNIVLIYGE